MEARAVKNQGKSPGNEVEVYGEGVQNLDSISNQNLWFFIPYFWTEPKIDTPFQASKIRTRLWWLKLTRIVKSCQCWCGKNKFLVNKILARSLKIPIAIARLKNLFQTKIVKIYIFLNRNHSLTFGTSHAYISMGAIRWTKNSGFGKFRGGKWIATGPESLVSFHSQKEFRAGWVQRSSNITLE